MITNLPNIENNLVIKAICIIGLINTTQMLNLIFSPVTKHQGALFPTYFMIAIVISLICLAGLWLLKKWAAITYSVVLVCNQIALLIMGFWEATALIIPVVIVGLLYKHRGEMV